MLVFWWVMGILFAATAIPSAFFFVLYLSSGEPGCERRYRFFYRWALLIFMVTFNLTIWRHVVLGLWALWR